MNALLLLSVKAGKPENLSAAPPELLRHLYFSDKAMHTLRTVFYLLMISGFILTSCSEPTRYTSWQTRGAFNVPQPCHVGYAPVPQPRSYLGAQFSSVLCTNCNGSGVVAAVDMFSPVPITQTCTQCKGQGCFTVKTGLSEHQ